MSTYKISLDNGVTGQFEAETVQDAIAQAQSAIDAVAVENPNLEPPVIDSVETI